MVANHPKGWEGCGAGVNGTQHARDGTPTIDSAFPDTAGMVKAIHAKGLAAGWYLNGWVLLHPLCPLPAVSLTGCVPHRGLWLVTWRS